MSEVMSEETQVVLKPGFHWQGDQVACVLSLAGTVIASSIPAVKFRSNDENYHNNFAKFKTAQGTNKGKCLIKHWNRATNTWDTCNIELTWVTCNLREHVKGIHKDYVPYKDLDPHYIEFISAAFSKIKEDRIVAQTQPAVAVASSNNILSSFKKQRKEGTPRMLLKCSIIGMLPLGLLENKGLGHLIRHYCGDLKGCSRRSLTRDLKTLYHEKRIELSVRLEKMLQKTISNDHALIVDKESRFRGLEQDIWTCRAHSYQGLVLQTIGKSGFCHDIRIRNQC